MLKSIDEEEKVKNIVPTLGGNQEMLFLTEDGLYEVLMLSRKPIAKEFKKEVKNILKQIRTTGGYIPVVYGGFGPDQKVILAKAFAEIHSMELKDLKRLITKNLDTSQDEEKVSELEYGVDVLDLNSNGDYYSLLYPVDFSKRDISISKNIFLLPEQGYMALVMIMRTEKAMYFVRT